MKRIIVCAAVFFVLRGLYAGPLETALEKEKKGDRAGAVASCEEWLKANPLSPEFVKTLFHAADIHPDLKQSIVLLEKYQGTPPDKAAQSAITGKTATLYEISGNFPKAQRLYEEAYSANPGEETFAFLYRSARLLFELGETRKSEDQARVISSLCKNPVTKKRAAFLLTRIIAASGNPENALALALRLTEDASGPADNESIYLFIFTLADSLGKQPERTLALQRLAKDYPDSPEFRIASQAAGRGGGSVSALPTPSALLNPFPQPKAPSAAASSETPPAAQTPAATPRQEPVATAVQTGSFSVRENAEYMVKDLAAFGFTAEIRETAGKTGNPVYKVVVPIPRPEETQTLLIRLKEKSIEGFLLF
jgi:tetratricopeptide (TPR) repeat protein